MCCYIGVTWVTYNDSKEVGIEMRYNFNIGSYFSIKSE